MSNDLKAALERGLAPGGDLGDELGYDNDWDWKPEDVDAIRDALATFPRDGDDRSSSPVHRIVGLFQDAFADPDSAYALRDRAIPELIRLYERLRDRDRPEDDSYDVLFILKILSIYRTREWPDPATETVIEALRSGYEQDAYMWSVVLGAFDTDHPHVERLMTACRERLPTEFAAVGLLDAANAARIAECEFDHPFDTDDGRQRLHDWLTSSDPEEFSYAHSATAALPFVSLPHREQLLSVAMDHADDGVRMEAAWASAHLGSESGLKMLARFCLDPNRSAQACRYLEELDREEAIPEEATDADFQALAAACEWLAHPSEFGRAPNAIREYDSRELNWPPTDDRRWLWLFEYTYEEEPDPEDEDDEPGEPDVGLVMVGSITFALFGETTADLSPEDAYALHCCWELEVNEDERGPEERTPEAGRAILAEDNPGFGTDE